MVVSVRYGNGLGAAAERLVLIFVSAPGVSPQSVPEPLTSQFGLSPPEVWSVPMTREHSRATALSSASFRTPSNSPGCKDLARSFAR